MELNRKGFKFKLKRFILHPLVIVPLIVAVGLISWRYYISQSRDLDSPVMNILADTRFNELNKDGVPTGWQLTKAGQSHVSTSLTRGYASGNSFQIVMSKYQSGSDELSSPVTLVKSNTLYFFKGFYKSSIAVDLLARYTYTDGSAQLYLVKSYPQTSGNWSTVSDTFKTGNNVKSIQFLYRISSNGSLNINGNYLEANNNVYYKAPSTGYGPNLIQNPSLNADDNGNPSSWNIYQTGKGILQFGLNNKVSTPYLYLVMSKYGNGEANWQPQTVQVSPYQYFNYGFEYQSNVAADIVSEYQLSNGQYIFETIGQVNPASEWTAVSVHFEAPANASSLMPSLLLKTNGYLNTTGNYLYNDTNTSLPNWTQPEVSITFDGGNESVYQNAMSALKADGFKSTFYLNPSTIDTKNVMTIPQLLNLKGQGNEIASQGYHYIDLTTVNNSRIDSELANSQSYLDQTFSQDTTDFAAPIGNSDGQVIYGVKKYFMTNRSTANGINTAQNYNPYNLYVFYVGKKTTVGSLQNAIDQAKQFNGWLILVYNQVGSNNNSSANSTNVSTNQFNQQMNMIKKSGITVQTVDQVVTNISKLK